MIDPSQTIQINASAASVGSVELPAPATSIPRKVLNARYELAERSLDNNEQFARATGGSALMNQSGLDRRTMIDRIRHEMFEADPWLHGSQRTTVTSVIGRGPWLEVKIPGDAEASRDISTKFNSWFRKVHGPRKMRTMCWAQGSDGNGLAMVVNNERVRGNVKLDFVPFEDEHIRRNPTQRNMTDRRTYLLDGVEQDEFGDPESYWIVKRHPNEYPSDEAERYDAKYVIDVFEKTRPSQGRGISSYATSTRNGPLRRSYRRATLDAATTAAKLTYILSTNVDRFNNGDVKFQDVDALEGLPLYYGDGMALPKGWVASQMKAEQPTTNHDDFMRSNVAEQGRAAGQPGIVAIGDAKGSNFATAQGARADWAEDVDVRRQEWETLCIDKLLMHWLEEAALVGEIDMRYRDIDAVPHEYRWTRRRHQDTAKEYQGRDTAIKAGLTSHAFWQTDDGVNPEAEDQAFADGYGITLEQFRLARFLRDFPTVGQSVLGLPAPENQPSQTQGEETDGSQNDEADDSERDEDTEEESSDE